MEVEIIQEQLSNDKEIRYQQIIPIITSVTEGESDVIANMANVVAIIKEAFSFFWVGFYIVKGEHLVLGPFQGPLACTRIAWGKGVCGAAWKERKTQLVPDVNMFPGHIACSSKSRSEIVIPLFHQEEIWAVLDIDSEELSTFDDIDRHYLEKIGKIVQKT